MNSRCRLRSGFRLWFGRGARSGVVYDSMFWWHHVTAEVDAAVAATADPINAEEVVAAVAATVEAINAEEAATPESTAACPFGFRDAPVGVQPDDLSCVDLGGANLAGADLKGDDLSGSYMSGADLSNADLSRRQPERRQPDRRRPCRTPT